MLQHRVMAEMDKKGKPKAGRLQVSVNLGAMCVGQFLQRFTHVLHTRIIR